MSEINSSPTRKSGLGTLTDLASWTQKLYREDKADELHRGAVFTIEQLEAHAKTLASNHQTCSRHDGNRLLNRLTSSEKVIARCYDLMYRAQSADKRLTPAAEWLLDNYYLIEEQTALTRKHFPRGYSRQLPCLASGGCAGLPRVYDLVQEYIAHVDGRVDDEALARYIAVYQSVSHLTLGELWSVPIMLRLALVENLRRVAISMIWQRAHRDSALAWVQRIGTDSDKQESAVMVLAEMVRENPPLSTAFVAQFMQALQGRGATTTFVLAWLEQRLSAQGQTIEDSVRADSRSQTANQASMANSIASLRLVNSIEWQKFVEANSATEAILVKEPSGVYPQMDFATRDQYRHVVEAMARRLHIDEELVARTAVGLAAGEYVPGSFNAAGHVGYVLVDDGKPNLERALHGKDPARLFPMCLRRGLNLLSYLGPVAALSAAAVTGLAVVMGTVPAFSWPILVVCAAIVASQGSIAIVNWFASLVRPPRALPRMNFESGIPEDCRTMVVVPTLLTGMKRVTAIMENLEIRYLANRDPNLWFGLLTDFCDADKEHVDGDDNLLAVAADGIQKLNEKYGNGTHGRFFLFHRPRLYNPQERCWMGRERKRGKIEDFNAVLCGGDRAGFSRIEGDVSQLTSIRYVITLDTDTNLPWGAGWRLVGAAAHPLNRPVMDTIARRLVRGYAILQPRVSISLGSSGQSYYSRLLAGDVGMDPYTHLVSDLYQDLFSETSFIGKGIYDVGAFRELLEGRFPDNAVLSHDLLESCFARSGQCSDVELLEDSPSGYLGDVSRRHRWMRGDWQIAPWLGFRVKDARGTRRRTYISVLARWKIFDNLRRAFVAPAYVILLALGWFVVPEPLLWTLAVLSVLFVPELLPGLNELWNRPRKLPVWAHLANTGQSTARRLIRSALWLAFLPFEATIALDAAIRSLWRMIFSGRRLLEWQTAAAVERISSTGFGHIVRRMWLPPAIAAAITAPLIVLGANDAWLAGGPLLLLWFVSPVLAWLVSRPLSAESTALGQDDVRFLRKIARLTWRYFEVFAGQSENWLPPDNMQNGTGQRIAHRTSPTDMGMSLLSNLGAYDMGYLSIGQLLDRSSRTMESMEQLKRYRGHFFNWYDTNTRKALHPYYVSTVDSGNLVGHVQVLAEGVFELPAGPLLPPGMVDGLRDTVDILGEMAESADLMQSVKRLMADPGDSLSARTAWLGKLGTAVTVLAESIDHLLHPEISWWARALNRQVRAFLDDLTDMAPWLSLDSGSLDDETQRLLDEMDRSRSLLELETLVRKTVDVLTTGRSSRPSDVLIEALCLGEQHISSRVREIDSLVQRCSALTDAEFGFLYDRRRKLMAIGYWVTEKRLDESFYDILASESRLASYAAIASGQIPCDHWFALGRRLTVTHGRQVLLSWSGSMFEYLMPLLVMPDFNGTLLDQTCHTAVARHIEYGRQLNVPWGISESCYNLRDGEGTYQYRAFGVPGLGLQRGLSDDVVIAPYASILALLIAPQAACVNLRRMAGQGYLGNYGFFEAVDFTHSRLKDGGHPAVVNVFMAHHHGMSLLALSGAVLGPLMQSRFMKNPAFRAASLLLQERIPRVGEIMRPNSREALVSRRKQRQAPTPTVRLFTNPNTPVPEVHLLSNGRYHVMVSAAGGGYSRWNDVAVTRWRADPTFESSGIFCFISDPSTGRCWSNSFQPTLLASRSYEAVFSSGRAEFRKKDEQIETHTEIAVSNEDDIEIRRIKVTNRSNSTRSLLVTTYAEIVMAPGITDESHRAYSNLFVQTELVPDKTAVLMTRRPQSDVEKPLWVFSLMLAAGDKMGPCSFETDRARFIGRGHTVQHPVALDEWGPLSGTQGPVLDPCMALRRMLHLAVDETAQFDLITGVATSREAAMELVSKYQDYRMADRVFEVAPTHCRAVLGQLGINDTEARHYGQLASAVIYPLAVCRAAPGILRRNRRGQPGLWGYAISGDLPIVLLRIGDVENLHLVRDLLKAHSFWRMRGLNTDLVIWNEDASGYRQVLNDDILELVAAGTESQLLDKPGGVFVLHVDSFPEEDRVLLQAVARIVILDTGGRLDEQLERWWTAIRPSRASMMDPVREAPPAEIEIAPITPRNDLIFANGTGGFSRDGREYIIDLPPGHQTPAPWVNVIANPRFGTVVSESGSAYTWFGNAQLGRLTPWSNDAVTDPSGEVIYIRDESTRRFVSPMPCGGNNSTAYLSRHGFGYSIFEHNEDGLATVLTTYVALNAPVKFMVLKIKNLRTRSRTLSVLGSVDLVLGDIRSKQAPYVITEIEPLTGAIVARNSYNKEFLDSIAFFHCSEPVQSVSGDRAEFLGRNRAPSNPAALRLRRLSGRLGPGLDPCAAIQVHVELAAGAEREIVFILGAGSNTAEAIALIENHGSVASSHIALGEVWRFWNDKLGVIYAETPDAALNVMVNGWLPYQVLSCRMWGRSGFYQSGGAYGFRDQLQDCLALMHEMPELARKHILLCASRQFIEGDVQHWWHPPGGRGVRTRCSDDYLWLPYAVSRYVAFTGDTGVLDEQIPYLTGRTLNEGEETYYDLPGRSDQTGTLYEHCTRAVSHGLNFGVHKLPLIGSGDWNDSMSRVGIGGKGESVWLGFFLNDVLSHFAPLALHHGDRIFARRCQKIADELSVNIEKHAWDGKWYRRAWFDNGEVIGSAQNSECSIDSLPQSWAAIAGVGDPGRRRQALDSLWEHLVKPDLKLIEILSPPFDHCAQDPGYIKGYPPGVRENGSQYTHGAIWAAMAFALAGRCDQAMELASMLNPINHALDPQAVELYRVEPYVISADIYSQPPHAGRGGWSWYTGSAAWMYRMMHEVIFGIERQVDTLRFRPRVPASWQGFTLHYRYYQTQYHFQYTQETTHQGPTRLTLDGLLQEDGILKLVNDQRDHKVEVVFGPCEVNNSPEAESDAEPISGGTV